MQRLEVRGAVRPLYGSLGVKGLSFYSFETTCTTVFLFIAEAQCEIMNLSETKICLVLMTNEWIN